MIAHTNVLKGSFEVCGEVQLHPGQLKPSVGDLHVLEDLLEVQGGESPLKLLKGSFSFLTRPQMEINQAMYLYTCFR